MITVISKNKLYSSAIIDLLEEFSPVLYQDDDMYGDVLLIASTQENVDEIMKKDIPCPVLLIGATHEEADMEIGTPCSIHELKSCILDLLSKKNLAPVFENQNFLFEGAKRRLYDKKNKKEYYLTEKETDLIVFLVRALPEGASKTDLLTGVWKYRADTETHTVETHIYSLRQKIGEGRSDLFIKNTGEGYILETD